MDGGGETGEGEMGLGRFEEIFVVAKPKKH
jgi:hypothetical protein